MSLGVAGKPPYTSVNPMQRSIHMIHSSRVKFCWIFVEGLFEGLPFKVGRGKPGISRGKRCYKLHLQIL